MNRHNRLGWRRKGFIFAFLAPTLIAFVIFYLYPIVTVFVTSFCKWDYTNINAPGGTEKFFSVGTFGSCHPDPDRYIDCTCIFQKDERGKIDPEYLHYPEYDLNSSYGYDFLTAI